MEGVSFNPMRGVGRCGDFGNLLTTANAALFDSPLAVPNIRPQHPEEMASKGLSRDRLVPDAS